MKDLYFDIKAGKKYRDTEDLYRELSEEFDELGESDISKFLKEEYELETARKRNADRDSLIKSIEKLEKNKKCCGRK